ncbi:putative HNHc nuclease [Velocimicrobium porci]|uniref:Uncharacterized protein n=1 Tax=Velocimicrobium porci TaxID=2606634 RepID=A0A6L5Y0V0_9FIRM|nr:hypothetical protein [Velocimicrobium porci]
MYELAQLQQYRIDETGTSLVIHIPNKNYQETIESKHVHQCGLWLDDGRHISAEQRKKAYATIRDISEYTGYLPEEQKEWLKYLHIERTGCQYFSLSNCSMTVAREFINTILEYALEEGVQLTDLALNRTDDIGRYLFQCIKHKRCAICGQKGEVHHWDAIGMGNDRKHYDDSKNRKICLCRAHHTECHTIGRDVFEDKYKVYGIVMPA